MEQTEILSLGEKRVRIKFNPSDDSTVYTVKARAAELIDFIDSIPSVDGESARLKSLAMTHIEDAAMWAVKAATYNL